MKKLFYSLIVIFFLPLSLLSAVRSAEIDANMSIYFDVLRQLDINYVDTLDYKKLNETAIVQMLRTIDPYTLYYPHNKDAELKLMTTGKYGGIGAIITQRETENASGKKERWVYISEPYEGMPAQMAGLWAGDKIVAINGDTMRGKSVREVSETLKGTADTKVTLTLERYGVEKPFNVEVTRKEVKLPAVAYSAAINGVGYIVFSEFTEHSAQEFRNSLDDLMNDYHISSLVIDLRGNGGGILDEAIRIVSNFVPRGTKVVETKGKISSSNRIYKTVQAPTYLDLPLVILVDENTASASEIVAGSLQDLKRATIVGERTFGKGLVQSIRNVAEDGHIKITTARYYLPSGRCIQKVDYQKKGQKNEEGGILPDIEIKDASKIDICYDLYGKQLIFDYATIYRSKHPSIVSYKEFSVKETDILDFCNFLEERKYVYQTETSKYFDNLLRVARQEDIDSTTYAQLVMMKNSINPTFHASIYKHEQRVKNLLNAEIIRRYYYQKGALAYKIRIDEVIQKGLDEAKKKATKR